MDSQYLPVKPNINNFKQRAPHVPDDYETEDLNKKNVLEMEASATEEEKNASSSKQSVSWVVIVLSVIVIILIVIIVYYVFRYNSVKSQQLQPPPHMDSQFIHAHPNMLPNMFTGNPNIQMPYGQPHLPVHVNHNNVQNKYPSPPNQDVKTTKNELDSVLNTLSKDTAGDNPDAQIKKVSFGSISIIHTHDVNSEPKIEQISDSEDDADEKMIMNSLEKSDESAEEIDDNFLNQASNDN